MLMRLDFLSVGLIDGWMNGFIDQLISVVVESVFIIMVLKRWNSL